MIDWLDVGSNALWVLGLAVMLAAWSYSRSCADRGRASGGWARVGAMLVCLGLAALGTSLLERALWLLVALCIGCEALAGRALRRRQLDADRAA